MFNLQSVEFGLIQTEVEQPPTRWTNYRPGHAIDLRAYREVLPRWLNMPNPAYEANSSKAPGYPGAPDSPRKTRGPETLNRDLELYKV